MPPPRESRWHRARRDTQFLRLEEAAVAFVGGGLSVWGVYRFGTREGALETFIASFLGAVAALVIVPIARLGVNFYKAKERIDADRKPLDDLMREIPIAIKRWGVFEDRGHGEMNITLNVLGEGAGPSGYKPIFLTKAHIAALLELEKAGDVRIIARALNQDAITGEVLSDAHFIPSRKTFEPLLPRS